MRLHVRLSVGKAQPKSIMEDASSQRVRSEMKEKRNRFKNTKLRSSGVRTTLFIQDALQPHQPQLVGSVLVISQQSATTNGYHTSNQSAVRHN